MTAIEPATISNLVAIDKKIDRNEKAALRLRWDFGLLMLAERKGGKQLPKGRLDQLIEATGKGRSELQYRTQFAERYPTLEEVSNALDTFTSWRDVIASFTASEDDDEGTNEPTSNNSTKQVKAAVGRLTGAAEKVLSDIVEGRAHEAMDDVRKGLVAAKDTIYKALAKLDGIDDAAKEQSKQAHPAGKGRQRAEVVA